MKSRVLSLVFVLSVLSGCYTSASFILPPHSDLIINDERISLDIKDVDGRVLVKRRPLFWTSIAGIEYILIQDHKIVKKDRLPSEFRIASIFWPPYAYIYWPVGFHFECYDLSDPKKEFIEQCTTPDEEAKKNKPVSQVNQ